MGLEIQAGNTTQVQTNSEGALQAEQEFATINKQAISDNPILDIVGKGADIYKTYQTQTMQKDKLLLAQKKSDLQTEKNKGKLLDSQLKVIKSEDKVMSHITKLKNADIAQEAKVIAQEADKESANVHTNDDKAKVYADKEAGIKDDTLKQAYRDKTTGKQVKIAGDIEHEKYNTKLSNAHHVIMTDIDPAKGSTAKQIEKNITDYAEAEGMYKGDVRDAVVDGIFDDAQTKIKDITNFHDIRKIEAEMEAVSKDLASDKLMGSASKEMKSKLKASQTQFKTELKLKEKEIKDKVKGVMSTLNTAYQDPSSLNTNLSDPEQFSAIGTQVSPEVYSKMKSNYRNWSEAKDWFANKEIGTDIPSSKELANPLFRKAYQRRASDFMVDSISHGDYTAVGRTYDALDTQDKKAIRQQFSNLLESKDGYDQVKAVANTLRGVDDAKAYSAMSDLLGKTKGTQIPVVDMLAVIPDLAESLVGTERFKDMDVNAIEKSLFKQANATSQTVDPETKKNRAKKVTDALNNGMYASLPANAKAHLVNAMTGMAFVLDDNIPLDGVVTKILQRDFVKAEDDSLSVSSLGGSDISAKQVAKKEGLIDEISKMATKKTGGRWNGVGNINFISKDLVQVTSKDGGESILISAHEAREANLASMITEPSLGSKAMDFAGDVVDGIAKSAMAQVSILATGSTGIAQKHIKELVNADKDIHTLLDKQEQTSAIAKQIDSIDDLLKSPDLDARATYDMAKAKADLHLKKRGIESDVAKLKTTIVNGDKVITYPTGEVRKGGTRSWRNNNVGNLRYTSFSKKHGAIGTDGGMAIFPDEETGRKAQEALFKTGTYKSLTIGEAISRYAPKNENDTEAYLAYVTKKTGLTTDMNVGSLTDKQLRDMTTTMGIHEGWKEGTTSKIQESYDKVSKEKHDHKHSAVVEKASKKWKTNAKLTGAVVDVFGDDKRIKEGFNMGGGHAKHSQHKHHNAFDINWSDMSNSERKDVIIKLRKKGVTGFGIGATTIHVDMRKKSARWSYYGGTAHGGGTMPKWAREAFAYKI